MKTLQNFVLRSLIAGLAAIICLSNAMTVQAFVPGTNSDFTMLGNTSGDSLFSLDLELDGVDDYASAPDTASLDLGIEALEDFTIETFFYVPDVNNNTLDTLIWKNGAYALDIQYSNTLPDRIYFKIGQSPMDVSLYNSVSLEVGWHHVAAVFDNEFTNDSDMIAIYLDGARIAMSTATDWTPGIPNSSSALNIGAYMASNPYQGWLEEMRFSNIVRYSGLSYTVPSGPFISDSNTRALWHFNETWGTTSFPDSSGNINTLTGINGSHIGNPTGAPPTPAAFHKLAPVNGATNQPIEQALSWEASDGATSYAYCYYTTNPSDCDEPWALTTSDTSVAISGLSINTTYHWQVRAVNASGSTNADEGTWWSFTTIADAPTAFEKIAPPNGTTNLSLNPTISWEASSGAISYEYCYYVTEPSDCDEPWTVSTANTSVDLAGLSPNTTYHWQVRAVNPVGTTTANNGTWWSFTTISVESPQLGPAFVVNSVNVVDDGVCGILHCSLPEAIKAANSPGSGENLVSFDENLGTATITLSSTLPNISDTDELIINGGEDVTINGNNTTRILYVNPGASLVLNDLKIENGKTFDFQNGGGVYNRGTLTVSNCTFANNNASGSGGAIASASKLTVSNSLFTDNSAQFGGGIFNMGELTVSDTTFSSNHSSESGAGIEQDMPGSTMVVTRSTFSGNIAGGGGGGIAALNSVVNVSDSTFFGNNGGGGSGGGMVLYCVGTCAILNSTFHANSTISAGAGGIAVSVNEGTVQIANSTFTNNDAVNNNGGAIFFHGNGTLTLTNNTLSSNSAGIQGGGIFTSWGTMNLYNNILADNVGGDCVRQTAAVNGINNVIKDAANTCGLTNGVNGTMIGVDPILGPLQDNGGLTQTMVLLPNSPAIDAGSSLICAATPVNNLDQRGETRPVDGNKDGIATCDIGAVEASPWAEPGIFHKTTPADGAVNQLLTLALSWETSLDATSYEYCIYKEGDPVCEDDAWINTGTTTSAALSVLAYNTTYHWQVRSVNADGSTEANAGTWWSFTTRSQLKVYSVGTQDGWILESTETSNAGGTMNATATTFNLGDGTGDKQYRSILSFNTTTLPDTAVITKVTLKIRVYGALVGNNNPFTWGQGLRVDVCKGTFGTSAPQLTDFNFNNATNCKLLAGTFASTPTSGWYNVTLISAARSKVNPFGLTQFRLRFYKDDNDDNVADYWRFFSGNYATATLRPTLIIEYYVP